MSWMVRILRSDPNHPWHWVSPTARWYATERHPTRPPGYETVCGERALPLTVDELSGDDTDRACCCHCLYWLAAHHAEPLAELPPLVMHPG